MAKKGQIQLQEEIENDEDWETLLLRDGLIVANIYSDWCGPCSAMAPTLRKVKMEYASDNLILAVACADNITSLKRFRRKSEPTWMFLSGGKVVNLMFGANAPKLARLIIEELENEVSVRGRIGRDVDELTPEEMIRFDIVQQLNDETERIQTERKQKMVHEKRLAIANVVLHDFSKCGVILVFPHAISNVVETLVELWKPFELNIASSEKPIFSEAMVEELLYFTDQTFAHDDVENLTNGHALAYLIKHVTADEYSGNIDEQILKLVYGESMSPPGSPNSPAQILKGKIEIVKQTIDESLPTTATSSTAGKSALEEALGITEITSYAELIVQSLSDVSKSALAEKLNYRFLTEDDENQFTEIQGLWAPPNDLSKATAIKLLFPKIYAHIALPEPRPTPPHIAITFDVLKRKEVFKLISEYPNEVLRYGFFTNDNPESAQLVAKTSTMFDRLPETGTTATERIVVQLSIKRSEAWHAFAQLGPTCMSINASEGTRQCKLFFPEGYDDVGDEHLAEDESVEESLLIVNTTKNGVEVLVDEEELDQ